MVNDEQDQSRMASTLAIGWEWYHEHQATLIARNGWMCEQHPGRPWPHDDCAGPGMPWMIEGRAAIEAVVKSHEDPSW